MNKHKIKATVIADSISPDSVRLTTSEWVYPRFIHGEVMTHRVFSRNAMSSRAVPVMKMLKQVLFDPASPIEWGRNQPGMQAKTLLRGVRLFAAKGLWRLGSVAAVCVAGLMHLVGVHKQIANRVLEPWQWMHTLVTSTEWDNFFELRAHPDAQPEFQKLANEAKAALNASTPKLLRHGEWHTPYVTDRTGLNNAEACKASSARCARVTALNHDGTAATYGKDLGLFERLAGSRPIHASPLEHQATPIGKDEWSGNFRGWKQFRKVWENVGSESR